MKLQIQPLFGDIIMKWDWSIHEMIWLKLTSYRSEKKRRIIIAATSIIIILKICAKELVSELCELVNQCMWKSDQCKTSKWKSWNKWLHMKWMENRQEILMMIHGQQTGENALLIKTDLWQLQGMGKSH